MPHNEPGNELEVTAAEAAEDLFSADARSRRGSRFREALLLNVPETFLVSGSTMEGGAITWEWYGSTDSATFWRDEMESVESAAATQYPNFHHATWGNDDYTPELGGPGLHAHSVFDQSLWDDLVAAAPAGSAIRENPQHYVGQVAETIVVEPGDFPGSHVFVARRTTADANSLVIKTADSAATSNVDSTSSALQTFLEDALSTLQSNHVDNFNAHFGFTSVPIEEAT